MSTVLILINILNSFLFAEAENVKTRWTLNIDRRIRADILYTIVYNDPLEAFKTEVKDNKTDFENNPKNIRQQITESWDKIFSEVSGDSVWYLANDNTFSTNVIKKDQYFVTRAIDKGKNRIYVWYKKLDVGRTNNLIINKKNALNLFPIFLEQLAENKK